jgi:class 3 adenylate cyclase
MTSTDATANFERKLATILSADVAGYSRLMAEDEEQTLRTFRGHKEVFEKLVTLHRGRVFNTAGDAILAEFNSAVEAVRCATEIQAALRTRNDQLPENRQVNFRMGVNLGDVMVQGSDLLGDGVNVAARLQSAAEPGGVCVSGSIFDQIRNKLSLSFKELGELNFRNIPQAVRVFSIAEADGLDLLPFPRGEGSGDRGGLAKGLAAAAMLLFTLGGVGIWAFSEHRRGQAELAREARLAAERLAADQARQRADTERQMAEMARLNVKTEPPRAEKPADRLVESEPPRAEAAQQLATVRPGTNQPPQAPASGYDGIYGGRICYGPSQYDPARCYRAQATVRHGKISGQWPGRDRGVTMYLAGDISLSGEIVIHMHGEKSDGSQLAVGDLTGTLREGRLDAAGSFMNGRTITLNWSRN